MHPEIGSDVSGQNNANGCEHQASTDEATAEDGGTKMLFAITEPMTDQPDEADAQKSAGTINDVCRRRVAKIGHRGDEDNRLCS